MYANMKNSEIPQVHTREWSFAAEQASGQFKRVAFGCGTGTIYLK